MASPGLSLVAGAGVPPDADTFSSAEKGAGLKTMIPSRLHAPPPPPDASHNVKGGPPDASIFLSFPSAKNPTKRLSGDQNGRTAPSVPASACAVSASSERIQRRDFPSALVAAKAIR